MNATSNDGAREQDANRDLWPLKLFLLQPLKPLKKSSPKFIDSLTLAGGTIHYSAFRFRSNQKKKEKKGE